MTLTGRVSPFGHPRIKGCSRLPAAYRRVPRPSSPLGAKASTKCPYLALDHSSDTKRPRPTNRASGAYRKRSTASPAQTKRYPSAPPRNTSGTTLAIPSWNYTLRTTSPEPNRSATPRTLKSTQARHTGPNLQTFLFTLSSNRKPPAETSGKTRLLSQPRE